MSAPVRWTGAWLPLATAAAEALRHARGRPRSAAAIEDESGGIHAAASIQVRDLPASSMCAESLAAAALRLAGGARAVRVVAIGPDPDGAPPPCGRCLQILVELGPDARVRWGSPARVCGSSSVRRLMPRAFDDYRERSPAP